MISKRLFDFINELSDRDTKSLTGKNLKLSEECGEMARKVLPYDNMAGTKHRFVTRDSIMEEVADVILVALSIARQLEMDEDDIEYYLDQKSVYWSKLQLAEAKDDVAKNKIPFELHITVEPSSTPEKFKAFCLDIGTKGIVLDLLTSAGEAFQDWMTSSRILGDNKAVMDEAVRIKNALTLLGYKVVRTKIETAYWHPAAPIYPPKKKGDGSTYFESHIGAIVKNEIDLQLVKDACQFYKFFRTNDLLNISGNASKVFNDGSRVYMITLRQYDSGSGQFRDSVGHVIDYLKDREIPAQKPVIEYAIFDDNPSHDDRWLHG